MAFPSCHQTSGCLVPMGNLSDISLEYCSAAGGVLTRNVTCDAPRTAFCANLNQTYFLERAESSGLGSPQCFTGAASNLKIRWTQALFLLLAFAASAFADQHHDKCATEILLGADFGNATLEGCGSTFTLVDGPAAAPTPSMVLTPRQLPCKSQVFNYKEHQVIATGTWWNNWEKVSACDYCGLSAGPCTREINWSQSSARTLSINFGLDSVESVANQIRASPSLNLGYSWTNTLTEGGAWRCEIPVGSFSSIWAQQRMGWADSQTRNLIVRRNGRCEDTTSYGEWQGVGRSDWPLEGKQNRQLGCSSGAAALC